MDFAYRFRLTPTPDQKERLAWTLDTCRQVRNHFLHRMNGVENPSYTPEQNRLPDLKKWWTELQEVNSKVLQMVVRRLYTDRSTLKKKKDTGHKVGTLRWKGNGYYHSFEYNQSGFELKKTSGREKLYLNKIGDVPVVAHRDIPDNATVKGVVVKREPTGRWYASLQLEMTDSPPEMSTELTETVGVDVGILNYAHDTDGTAVGSLDLSAERERLEREQRKLSRKEHGSNNWEKQRKRVAECHATIKRKRRDFLHKRSTYYATEYDLVAVEALNAKGLMELPSNSRNRAAAAWGTFRRMLEYKCEREGTHFVAVEPAGTIKECAACGVATDKPLWVREHSCPSCGFTADRDWNAAYNILSRGIKQVGVGHSEITPVETALPTGTSVVPAKRVVETGSPGLKERTAVAVSE